MSAHRLRSTPDSPTDPTNWAILFTRARLRRGWSLIRLSIEADVPVDTVERVCRTGRCSSPTALKLFQALEITVAMPTPRILTAQEAQHGVNA